MEFKLNLSNISLTINKDRKNIAQRYFFMQIQVKK